MAVFLLHSFFYSFFLFSYLFLILHNFFILKWIGLWLKGILSNKCPFFIPLNYLFLSLFSFFKNKRHIHFLSYRYFYYSVVISCIKDLLKLCNGIGRFGDMKKIIIILLISFNLNAQIDSLSLQDSQKKIELDTKLEMSRNYSF